MMLMNLRLIYFLSVLALSVSCHPPNSSSTDTSNHTEDSIRLPVNHKNVISPALSNSITTQVTEEEPIDSFFDDGPGAMCGDLDYLADMEMTMDSALLKKAAIEVMQAIAQNDMKTFLQYVHRDYGITTNTSKIGSFDIETKDFKYLSHKYEWEKPTNTEETAFIGTISDYLKTFFYSAPYLEGELFIGEHFLSDERIPKHVNPTYETGNFVVLVALGNDKKNYSNSSSIQLDFEMEAGFPRLFAIHCYDWGI